MKKEILENYSYEKLIFELIKLAQLHKFGKKLIGQEKFEKIREDYPLYQFTVNPEAKINFCIITGMHGDEIAGPLTIYHLFKNPNEYFASRISYHIYPVISPTAFDLRQRFDDDNVELNTLNKKTLKNKKYCEIKSFYGDAKNKEFEAVLSLHEDMDQEKFYAYVNEKEETSIYRKIMESTSKYCPILDKKVIDHKKSNRRGLVVNVQDQTVENWLCQKKKPKIYITTETPGKLDLKMRIAINLNNIKILNRYILKI